MSPLLLSLVIIAQASSQPSASAAGSDLGHAADVSAQVTVIIELGEHALSVQESWALGNRSGKTIPPAELGVAMPEGAKMLRTEEGARGFVARPDSRALDATESLGAGGREVALSYLYDFSGSRAEIRRPIPFAVEALRLIVQDVPGLAVTSNVTSERRSRDLNGRRFVIYEMAGLRSGTHLDLALSGLPALTLWPRRAATAIAVAIVGWMVWMLSRGRGGGKVHVDEARVGPLSASARRDQIVKAIEVLEREASEGKVKVKRFERRRRELIHELSLVLHEMELEGRPSESFGETEKGVRGPSAP